MPADFISKLPTALAAKRSAFIGAPLLVAAAGALALMGTSGDTNATDARLAAATSPVPSAGAAPTPIKTAATASAPSTDKVAKVTPVADVAKADRAQIEAIIKDYLLKNPEILVQMSQELEKRQQAAQATQRREAILANKDNLFRSEVDYVFGNPDGKVSVVEYFDYNCAWCKRALDQVQQLAEADKKVRVVMKEMPIFGADSTFAAKAAMASKKQGKYWPFHVAMMKEERVTTGNVLKIAADVGLDVEKLKADMKDPAFDKAIAETLRVAEQLGTQGTPGFIVDTKVNVGFVPLAGLQKLISEVRAEGCKVC